MNFKTPRGAHRPVHWPTDEDCLPPQRFIDYPALELMLDRVCPPGFERFSPGSADLRFSTASVEDLAGFFQACAPDRTFFIVRAIHVLQQVLPAVIELRDSGGLPHTLTRHTFSHLLSFNSLKKIVTHADLSLQARSSLIGYLQECEYELKSLPISGLGLHASVMATLHFIIKVWEEVVEEFMFISANRLKLVRSDYGVPGYRKAVEEYANLVEHLQYVSEFTLIFYLRAAGEKPSDFLPYFSLAARGAAFSNDLGL